MFCLKSSVLDIDFNKFIIVGKFNTRKIAKRSSEAREGGELATPKKRIKKANVNDDDDDDKEASLTKKKTLAKKGKKAGLSTK
ncbi:hypothetical protein LTR36_001708 [Oleoguttula mirabilis]|uniref:Uncharacterized protein n=1 Tax=Oleoguttula mirabilis TaxID=1507867 RepID=A0AAV9J4D9_9PEZI|nr:hypothetical protein LTR36_001708 [Oleoguttula mirabilis]